MSKLPATKTFANKSNARRAAKQAGILDTIDFVQYENGTWGWTPKVPTEQPAEAVVSAVAEAAAEMVATVADSLSAVAAALEDAREPTREDDEAELAAMAQAEEGEASEEQKAQDAAPQPSAPAPIEAKPGTYAALKTKERSKIINPVAFVHKFLVEKGKGMTRKQAVAALVDAGVNYSTARTQYQRWFEGA